MTNSGGLDWAGVLFSFDPSTASYTKLYNLSDSTGSNGFGDIGNLMQAADGKLYGTTDDGGAFSNGVLFSYNITARTYTKLKDFGDAEPKESGYIGEKAVGRLREAVNGKLYGIWQKRPYEMDVLPGERYNPGGVYSFDPVTGAYTKLKDFNSTTGFHPKDSYFVAAPAERAKQ
jgi:uncharacterized repeat protein (TIGR03803 family)